MKSIKAFINGIFNRKVDAIGLSVFRVLYGSILLIEIVHLYKFRHLVFDKDPFVYSGEIESSYLLYFWMVTLVCLILGLFTRAATIVNYIFTVLVFSSAHKFEYHVYYTYTGVNFLMMFLPLSRVFSLDSLIQKLKFTNIGRPYKPNRMILEINYLAPVFIGIALIYFDSIFQKFSSHTWLDGLGIWRPSSLPMYTENDTSAVLNNEFLVKFLSWFVLAFESLYIFLFWFRKWRVPLLVIGILFHIGILIAYPIPLFALTYCCLNLLLVPVSFWQKMARLFYFKKPLYTFYYDAECPLCSKVVVAIYHFDIFNTIRCATVQGHFQDDVAIAGIDEETLLINIHGVTRNGKVYVGFWAYVQLFKSMVYTYPIGLLISLPGISWIGKKIYNYIAGDRLTVRCTSENCAMPTFTEPVSETQDYLVKGWNRLALTKKFWKVMLLFLFLCQCLIIWFSPTMKKIIPQHSKINTLARNICTRNTRTFLEDAFGIRYHAVFVDKHFTNFNHIVKIHYHNGSVDRRLPLIDDNGICTGWTSGIIWRNFAFNVLTARVAKDKIENNVVPYLKMYVREENLAGTHFQFDFYVKEIEVPQQWEKNFLRKQMKKPWIKAGSCSLDSEEASFTWNETAEALFAAEATNHQKQPGEPTSK
jgi:predicted DCC family thiol-disulfide oxidoreductase YuxK